MTTTITSSLNITSQASKTVSTTDTTVTAPSVQMSVGTLNRQFNGSSSPSGTEAWSGLVTLTAGSATIDLTNLTQAGLSGTFTMSGLKLRFIHLSANTGNSGNISVSTGASNGYAAVGALTVIAPGDVLARTTSGASAVDGTHKTLDLAGTGTDAIKILLVFGP